MRRLLALTMTGILLAACGGAAQPSATPTPTAAPPVGSTPAPTDAPAERTPLPTKAYTVLLPFREGITFWPVILADELGYLQEEGIDMTLEVVNGSSALMQQIGAGNAQFGVSLAPNILLAAAEDVPVKVFYDLTNSNIFDVKTVASSPLNSIADLRNTTIGVIDLTRGDLPLLRATLAANDIDPQTEVQFAALGFDMASHAQALLDDRVQALNISWNNTVSVEHLGVELKCLSCERDLEVASQSVLVHGDVWEREREYVEAFGRALAKAVLFGMTNPDAARAIMAERVPEEHTDEEYARKFMAAAIEIMRPREDGQFGLSDMETWERLQEIMLHPTEAAAIGLSRPVDLSQLVSNELVDAYGDFDQEAVKTQAQGY